MNMKLFYCVLLVSLVLSACAGGTDDDDSKDDDSTDDDDSADDDDDTSDDDTTDDDDDSSDDDADDDSTDDDTSQTTCLIEGVTYNDGDTNPLNACLVCDPSESTENWTMNDGAACDNGVFCDGADVCLGGMCSVHSGTPCPDDGLYCTGIESCDEVNDECYAAYNPCPTDETCLEDTDVCEPTAGTCHGAAWMVHDVCEYDIPQPVGQSDYSMATLETACNLIDSYYGKDASPGVFFNCLDTCGREQACDPTCMDSCQGIPVNPGGTECDAVTHRLATCGAYWVLLQSPNYMLWPLQDAMNTCENWDNPPFDWACMSSCMLEITCNQFENCVDECLYGPGYRMEGPHGQQAGNHH